MWYLHKTCRGVHRKPGLPLLSVISSESPGSPLMFLESCFQTCCRHAAIEMLQPPPAAPRVRTVSRQILAAQVQGVRIHKVILGFNVNLAFPLLLSLGFALANVLGLLPALFISAFISFSFSFFFPLRGERKRVTREENNKYNNNIKHGKQA